ncbi:MAG: ABC transporter permease [Planctomycetaceae bacterium]|nr:ABC transporter permease [Planctomycetaceae bacterium]
MWKLVAESILFYRRIQLVVLLAVAISTAVIAGSLIIGDSVRHSLRQMTEQRLGAITHVLSGGRFFREALCEELQQAARTGDEAASNSDDSVFCPAILITSSVETTQSDNRLRRVGSVNLLGLTEPGWNLLQHGQQSCPSDRDVVLGFRTAEELQVAVGDEVSVWIEMPTSIPRDSLLGERDDVNVELVLTVSGILNESDGASRFDLNPGQQLPFNAFVSLATLQGRLGLEEQVASRRNPVAKPARVNTILVAPGSLSPSADHPQLNSDSALQEQVAKSSTLSSLLGSRLQLSDVGLKVRQPEARGYLSVESDRMILETPLAQAATAAADQLQLNAAPTLVYLVNQLSATDEVQPSKRYSMYSIVAGMPLTEPPPLGEAVLSDGAAAEPLSDDEILLSAWLAEDLEVAVGDHVYARWHDVGSHGELPEVQRTFTVKGVLAADDPVTVDRNLTPDVPGITDVESFSDWDQPFEMDMDRITPRDDSYWTEHRATPKAFIAPETAQQLWNSRYGSATSIRVAPKTQPEHAGSLDELHEQLQQQIIKNLNPSELGLIFRPIRAEGLQAAVGANDFTQLFLGFSFFLILAAIILASLMFRLGLQQRIRQLGLLNALGWTPGSIRNLYLAEGMLVCFAGTVVGVIGGVLFARLMLYGLTTWWIGAVGTRFLSLDVRPSRLITAGGISLVLAYVVILLGLKSFRRIHLRDQLAGNSDAAESLQTDASGRWPIVMKWLGRLSLVTAVVVPLAVIQGWIPTGEAFGGLTWLVVCFFVAGMACLTGALYLLSLALHRHESGSYLGQSTVPTVTGPTSLAVANAARNPLRSLLTTALIAFATFVIVAVGAGRRNPLSETPQINSGNGGFTLVAETAQPVLYDLNTSDGRRQLGFDKDDDLSGDTSIYAFSMKPGSDASCVNLYQTRVPTMLGASDAFLDRGGFRFADTRGENPWLMLRDELPRDEHLNIPVIPVIGDMNTLMFSLKKDIGSRILVPNDDEPQFALQIVGKLDGSVFQGVLVTSDRFLKQIDPDVAGTRYFLIETPSGPASQQLSSLLESRLNDYGFDAESVSQRIAGFLAVQNTYLSTFQLLGSLGLLIGTFGLAAVMVRNIVERQREIALMKAVGFTTRRIFRLIVLENGILLLWGIAAGTASALLAMLPHLRSTGADVPWLPLLGTLLIIAGIGSSASLFAVRQAAAISIRENLSAD